MNTQTLFVIIGSVSGAYLWLVDTAIIKALKLGRFHLHLQYSVTLWCEYYGGMWKLFVHLNCYSGEKRFSYDCNECTKKGHFTKCLRSSSNPAGGGGLWQMMLSENKYFGSFALGENKMSFYMDFSHSPSNTYIHSMKNNASTYVQCNKCFH